MEKNALRSCFYCEKPINGRRDKKFCDTNCRVLFHQEKKQIEEAHYLKVLEILKKNRKILKRLNPTGHSTLRRSFLLEMGYNFNYYTNTYKTKSGGTYFFCFEFGFRETHNPDKINIVIWQDYMDID